MKRISALCTLSLFAAAALADTCPKPQPGFDFRVAAWGNHVDPAGPVRCHYYYYDDPKNHYQLETSQWYSQADIDSAWGPNSYRYNLCSSDHKDVNDCQFSHLSPKRMG